MKLAYYALLSPLFVAVLILGTLGLFLRGVWYSLHLGYTLPDCGKVPKWNEGPKVQKPDLATALDLLRYKD